MSYHNGFQGPLRSCFPSLLWHYLPSHTVTGADFFQMDTLPLIPSHLLLRAPKYLHGLTSHLQVLFFNVNDHSKLQPLPFYFFFQLNFFSEHLLPSNILYTIFLFTLFILSLFPGLHVSLQMHKYILGTWNCLAHSELLNTHVYNKLNKSRIIPPLPLPSHPLDSVPKPHSPFSPVSAPPEDNFSI